MPSVEMGGTIIRVGHCAKRVAANPICLRRVGSSATVTIWQSIQARQRIEHLCIFRDACFFV